MYILHSGDGHYHLGGGYDHHEHGEDAHNHNHGHTHNKEHKHEHKEHSHDHKKKSKQVVGAEDLENEDLKENLLADHHHDEEEHNHDHKEHKHKEHKHDHGHSHDAHSKIAGININVESAYLHVLGDMLMSVGVIIAATVVYMNPALTIADPICTYLFSVIICFTTVPVFKDCIKVMMEGTPDHINVETLMEEIFAIEGVEEIHDFHVWSISVGKFALSAHI